MTVALGVMQLPVPVAGDNLPAYETGALRDGGLWTALGRLADHDHSGGEMGGPVAGGGGGTGVDVTLTGTEGVTVVEAPANTFALGLTASADALNTLEIRSNGIYSNAPTRAQYDALVARVAALEATAGAGDAALRTYVQRIMSVLDPGGPPPPPP